MKPKTSVAVHSWGMACRHLGLRTQQNQEGKISSISRVFLLLLSSHFLRQLNSRSGFQLSWLQICYFVISNKGLLIAMKSSHKAQIKIHLLRAIVAQQVKPLPCGAGITQSSSHSTSNPVPHHMPGKAGENNQYSSLSHTWYTLTKLLAAGFCLAKPQPLQPFEEQASRRKTSLSICSPSV